MSNLGLGIDAGGTQTRWALADAAGAIVAEGSVSGMSATQMGSAAGRDAVRGLFAMLATQVLAVGRPVRVCAGLTGFDGVGTQATQLLAEVLKLAPAAISMRNDVEIAYLDSFAPGEGYLVYAAPALSLPGSMPMASSIARVGVASRWTMAVAASGSRARPCAISGAWKTNSRACGSNPPWRAPCLTRSAAVTGRCRASSSMARIAALSVSWRWLSLPVRTPIRWRVTSLSARAASWHASRWRWWAAMVRVRLCWADVQRICIP